jgi:hypothetical protein
MEVKAARRTGQDFVNQQFVRIKLKLSKNQVARLRNGHNVQVNPSALNASDHFVYSSKKNALRIAKARKAGRGCRLSLTKDEYDQTMEGEGFKDLVKKTFKGAKKVGKFYKENVKEFAGPLVKQAVTVGKDALLASIAVSNPELIPVLKKVDDAFGDEIIDKLGTVTGAYGVKQMAKTSKASREILRKWQDNSNNQMVSGKAYQPVIMPYYGGMLQCDRCHGGSFRVQGQRGGSFSV